MEWTCEDILVSTGRALILFVGAEGERFWGVEVGNSRVAPMNVSAPGENLVGKMLMEKRQELLYAMT